MGKEVSYSSAEKAFHLKRINSLTWENNNLKKERDRYKKLWKNQLNITENLRNIAFDAACEKDEMKKERDIYQQKAEELENKIKLLLGELDYDNLKELLTQLESLKNELLREKAKANNDGTNSGIPTSQTPYNKKKVNPNSREKSDKNRGGQLGHIKHSLKALSNDEITDTVDHILKNCPNCNSSNLIFLGKRSKDVIENEVVIKKIRHYFYEYQCLDCGRKFHSSIPLSLKESVQYGPNIQALGLALQNIGFVSINRTRSLINSIMGNGFCLSEGYLCKLQKRASKMLSSFVEEVRLECLNSKLLHWDDTVIFVDTLRACMRFYGNDKIALYKAHEKKDREGIDEDQILGVLGPETTVVHDHVTMNYNDDFHYRNAECIQHLIRDIQKIIEISKHSWAIGMKKLITQTIHERNQLVEKGDEGFNIQQIVTFYNTVDQLLMLANEQFKESIGTYYEDEERRLITRIEKYKENHFLWVEDFTVPPTNNLAERSLRSQKVKLKVSGQYLSIKTAGYFADIRTYTETCYRHGINTFDALVRLTSGNPYTLKELKGEV